MALISLFILLALCTGSRAQPVVTQEPSLTVIPGGTVTLTCSSSTGAVTSGHYPAWIQQKSGQSPMGLIYHTSSLVPGVPARFSGSLLGDKAALTIKGAQPEDEAHYYCVLWYRSRAQPVVTQEPSLTVIPGGTVTLTCSSSTGAVTSGHYPAWIQQKSGQSPRGLIYDTNNLVSGVPARFSGSLLGDKAALTIKGAQPEDEAHYYCNLWYSGSSQPHSDRLRWGTETKTFCRCLAPDRRLLKGVWEAQFQGQSKDGPAFT
ncbi:immunoglobulin lambda-1 light chain-like [Antechinus flavipes]|uniref:immunoglobulin lambda-1 light chain-like n=1 Tax=Antechinus flavipes TaxID=38775 RepID=UPI002235761E|nr:immunoglobulin lambda-1 light chain-like [Antechinus flavipes]